MIEEWSGKLSSAEAMVALAEAELPSAPIWDISQTSASEHAAERKLVVDLPHDDLGAAPIVGQPVWFNGSKPVSSEAAPDIGRDAGDVLSELCGLDSDRMQALKDAGVVT